MALALAVATDSGTRQSFENAQTYFSMVASWEGTLATIQVVCFVLNASAFCWFVFRGLKYLNQLAPERQTIGPAFAVWSNIIPIVNLFAPFLAVRDIWEGSHQLAQRPTKPPISLALWWLFWLGAFVFQLAASTTLRAAEASMFDAAALFRASLALTLASNLSMMLSISNLLSVTRRATTAFDEGREIVLRDLKANSQPAA